MPNALKLHVPVVERLLGYSEKAWLKLTPLGICSLAECDWLFGLLPLGASDEQRVDLFDVLKSHFQTVETVLFALHKEGIFHCDVKPSNIVLMHQGKGLAEARLAKTLLPMLIDFSAFGDDSGLIATTVWFSSRALLLDSGPILAAVTIWSRFSGLLLKCCRVELSYLACEQW